MMCVESLVQSPPYPNITPLTNQDGLRHRSYHPISIRKACPSDGGVIAKIAAALDVRNGSNPDGGFLVYTLRREEYELRVRDNQHVYVFQCSNHPVGFVCGYDRRLLRQYLADSTLSHEATVCRTVLELAKDRGHADFRFLDQIGILPPYQNHGLGEAFFLKFIRTIHGPFYAAMLEEPLRNPRIEYWQKRGFERIGYSYESVPPHLGVNEWPFPTTRLLWGIYILQDKAFTPWRSLVRRIFKCDSHQEQYY